MFENLNQRRVRTHFLALTVAALAFAPLHAAVAAACQIDEAQQLFANRAATVARITPLLDACVASGSTDPRIPLLRGVLARDRGDLALAARLFAQARSADPHSLDALLESGITAEWQSQFTVADGFYQTALTIDPNARGALLGRARVARAERRPADAAAIYQKLLALHPQDAEALNGLGRLRADRNDERGASAYFAQALAADPNNADARTGLDDASYLWTQRLDVAGGWTNATGGDSWSTGALFTARTTSNDTVDAGILHNSNELPAVGFTDQRQLPKNDYHVAWNHEDLSAVSWSLAYDDREHLGLASEQWIGGSVTVHAGANVSVFATYRTMFGAPEWNGYLASLGTVAGIGDHWSVQVTGYDSGYRVEPAPGTFGAMVQAGAADLEFQRQAGRIAFFAAGAGYNPTIRSVVEHARAEIPLSHRTSLLIFASHQTAVPQTQVLLGGRFSW